MNKRLHTTLIVILTLFFFVSPGGAKDRESAPNGIIVKPPKPSGPEVNLELNRPRYRPGSEVEMELNLNKRAYLYLYNIDTEGKVNLLFPNKYEKSNHLGPGKVSLPGKGYSFIAGGKEGTEYLGAIASTQPLELFTSINQEKFENNPFPRLSQDAQSFALSGKEKISSEVSPKDWAISWTRIPITEKLSEISVFSHPANAKVYVDEQFIGRTPVNVSVEPGNREVNLQRTNYEDWSDTVFVKPYRQKRIEPELQPISITRLTVNSTPSGADVYVDGKFHGRTPVSFFAESGNRRVRISKQGYETWEEVIEVQPYLSRNLGVNLPEIQFSRVSVESTPPGASIFVSGEYRGTTPADLKLPADKPLEIVLSKKGYEKWERDFVLTPQRKENINVNLRTSGAKGFKTRAGNPELGLGINGGGIFGYAFSLGSEIEVNNFVFGGSFRSTGNPEVPQEINWVSGSWKGSEILNYGPEWEGNFGYKLDLFPGIYLRAGSGLALQPKVHLESLEGQTSSFSAIRSMIEIKRNARLEVVPYLTIHTGIGLHTNRYSIDLIFHNRRGPILNFGLKF
ncbi:PEGA domain-containing protein [Candidatus Bipolaricaulota bacterium]|nr:PEGA domain-containing protein [Candidatus Bipolaricaulota bacterium]